MGWPADNESVPTSERRLATCFEGAAWKVIPATWLISPATWATSRERFRGCISGVQYNRAPQLILRIVRFLA